MEMESRGVLSEWMLVEGAHGTIQIVRS